MGTGIATADLLTFGSVTYNGSNYNLIYDGDQGLIWLDYTSTMGAGWDYYIKWVSELNAPGALTYNFNSGVEVTWNGDWRLPNTVDGKRVWGYDGTTTAGFNITTSEMGNLFYKTLGNRGCYDARGKLKPGWIHDAAWGLKNKGPFTNLYADTYWSDTEYEAYTEQAWAFNFSTGAQTNTIFKHLGSRVIAMAVRPGRVDPGSVHAK